MFVQVNRGTKLVIMDQSGGADAITIARSVRELSRRKVYVVAVRHFVTLNCKHTFCVGALKPLHA